MTVLDFPEPHDFSLVVPTLDQAVADAFRACPPAPTRHAMAWRFTAVDHLMAVLGRAPMAAQPPNGSRTVARLSCRVGAPSPSVPTMTLPTPIRVHLLHASTEPHFAPALACYERLIPAAGRTGGDEIAYWTDRGGRVAPTTRSQAAAFVCNDVSGSDRAGNDRVVGFAHWGVIATESGPIANLDYLALEPEARSGPSGRAARAALWEALDRTTRTPQSAARVVTEVLCDPLLTRWCRLNGFALIDAPYAQPPLGDGPEEEAVLLVRGVGDGLDGATYLSWVRALALDYYLPWHRPFLTDVAAERQARRARALVDRVAAGCPEGAVRLVGGGGGQQH